MPPIPTFLTPLSLPPSPASSPKHSKCPISSPFTLSLAERSPLPSSPAQTPPSSPLETDALIIGSGISGSTLAFQLHKTHPSLSVLLTEARDVVGGNVISKSANGYLWEEGPNTFQPARHIMKLAVDLGLTHDIVLADHTLPRFVYWNQALFALPMGPADIPSFRLLSLWGAIRAGLGALGFVMPNFTGKEESVKEFISRHLGVEVFQKMIDPFVSGVYAGDPGKLSMKSAFKKIFRLTELGGTEGILEGAIIRIAEKKREEGDFEDDLPKWKGGSLGSFRKGLGMVPERVRDILGEKVRVGWKVVGVELLKDGRYKAIFATSEGEREVIAKVVGITAPAGATAGILKGLVKGVERITEIEYPCVWSVSLGYPKEAFKEPLKGFGNLIPRSMGVRTLGTIWSSCLFEGRAPEGMELLLSYIGGMQDAGIRGLSEEEVVKAVDGDIRKILIKEDWKGECVKVGVRKWEKAIPQYNLGYGNIMEDIEKEVEELKGLFLGGNYTSGVAFGDCVMWGIETADAMAQFVEQQVEA